MLSTPQNSDPLTGSAWAAEKMKHPIKKKQPSFLEVLLRVQFNAAHRVVKIH